MLEIVASIVSLVALAVATTSMFISYRVYRLEHDPDVVVYATPDEKRPSVVNLIVENSGGSAAHDVTFEFSSPMPGKAFGFEDAPDPSPMNEGPLVTGIPSFGPGSRRVITWGQYGGIHKGIGDSSIDVTARFFGRRFLGSSRRKYQSTSRVDIKSFAGTDISDHNWDKKLAESLREIADAVSSLSEPARRLLNMEIREMDRDEYDPDREQREGSLEPPRN